MFYYVASNRLHVYLRKLCVDCETPHSFREGCAVALALSGLEGEVGHIMRHVGWF